MNVLIAVTSTITAAAALGTFAIVARLAYEMNGAKEQLEADVADVKAKVSRNAKTIKNALSQLEL